MYQGIGTLYQCNVGFHLYNMVFRVFVLAGFVFQLQRFHIKYFKKELHLTLLYETYCFGFAITQKAHYSRN